MPVRDPFQISALKFSRDLELAGQLCTPRKWRPSYEREDVSEQFVIFEHRAICSLAQVLHFAVEVLDKR